MYAQTSPVFVVISPVTVHVARPAAHERAHANAIVTQRLRPPPPRAQPYAAETYDLLFEKTGESEELQRRAAELEASLQAVRHRLLSDDAAIRALCEDASANRRALEDAHAQTSGASATLAAARMQLRDMRDRATRATDDEMTQRRALL